MTMKWAIAQNTLLCSIVNALSKSLSKVSGLGLKYFLKIKVERDNKPKAEPEKIVRQVILLKI